jgi:nucleoside 2-deoxyribosyltransferase
MKKVYFAGSIRGGRDNVDDYFKIIEHLKKDFTVLTEHIGDKNLNTNGEVNKTPEFIHYRDKAWVIEADFIVAEISNPSLGVGYEIGLAESLNKPILCLYKNKEDVRVSFMILGNQSLTTYGYNSIEEVYQIINSYFKDKK